MGALWEKDIRSEDRARRLEDLPGWSWDDPRWYEALERLKDFAAREGHARVPRRFVDDGGFSLGQWASVQRRRFRLGQLPPERAELLKQVPGWPWEMT